MKFLRIISQLTTFKVLLIALMLSGAYFLMYFNNGDTLKLELENLRSQQTVEEAKKKDTEATIKREDEMQANLAALARDLQVVKAKLPNELKDTEMTGLINQSASQAGISVTSLARKKSVASKENKAGSESVEEVSFDLSMEGQFNYFVRFVDALSKAEKVVKIRDFSIERGASLTDPNIKFKGEIVGYKQAQVQK